MILTPELPRRPRRQWTFIVHILVLFAILELLETLYEHTKTIF